MGVGGFLGGGGGGEGVGGKVCGVELFAEGGEFGGDAHEGSLDAFAPFAVAEMEVELELEVVVMVWGLLEGGEKIGGWSARGGESGIFGMGANGRGGGEGGEGGGGLMDVVAGRLLNGSSQTLALVLVAVGVVAVVCLVRFDGVGVCG